MRSPSLVNENQARIPQPKDMDRRRIGGLTELIPR